MALNPNSSGETGFIQSADKYRPFLVSFSLQEVVVAFVMLYSDITR